MFSELTEEKKKVLKGGAITLLGAACWGANATVAKYLLDEYSVDPTWLVAIRQLGSCWLFLLTAYLINKPGLKAAVSRPKNILRIFLFGIFGILSSNLTYIQTIGATNPATATILQMLSVVFVMIWTCLRTWSKPNGKEAIGVVLALVGTFLLATGGNIHELQLSPEGFWWGMGTALSATVLVVASTRILDEFGSFVVNGLAMLIVGCVFSLIVKPWNMMPVLDGFGVFLVCVSVVVGTYGAYALFLQGAKEIGSMKASLLNSAEPLMAILTSMVFLGTTYSTSEFIGFILIIIMIFFTA